MPNYTIVTSPDDIGVFGPGGGIHFAASSQANAQALAQSLSTLLGVNLILRDPSTAGSGVAYTKYTPAGGSPATVNTVAGITHHGH
jgi:hypothetical protein